MNIELTAERYARVRRTHKPAIYLDGGTWRTMRKDGNVYREILARMPSPVASRSERGRALS